MIAFPRQNQRLSLTNVSWLLEGCYDRNIVTYFLVGEELSNDDVEEARGTVIQEIRPGAGFKTGDFVKEKLGGLP